ncbi:tetratricopeptide repeat protein [Asaia sp. BMEF1]|uniref:tetratricopeptide repeat protein n=1 Tax=Asaia sp. BMEF1 TaxID=3155932 RepID=UPI003F678F40
MSQDAGSLNQGEYEPSQAENILASGEETWWKIPGSPPDPKRFSRSCEAFFIEEKGIAGLQRVLETVSLHQDEWALSMAGASLILRYTTRYDIVEVLLRNVLRMQPENVAAHSFLAHLLVIKGDLAGGCAKFAELMARHAEQRTEIGEFVSMSLLEVGYPAEALNVAMSLLNGGDVSASLLNNAGCALERLNRSREALGCYEKALQISPDRQEIVFGYACTLIKAGQFERGWPVYFERALQISQQQGWLRELPRLRPGVSLAGKRVLLFQEQGLGDTLQFIRHAPSLVERGAHVTVHVPRSLVRLLRASFQTLTVVEPDAISPTDDFDYVAPIPDLPYVTGVDSVQKIPVNVPYLHTDAADVEKMSESLPHRRPRIGLVWAGERRSRSEFALADMRRSIDFKELAAALLPVEASLISLQFGPSRDGLRGWNGQEICDPMDEVTDLADTAAIMQTLDLVISVDTSPAHLAGALGRPVWLISRWDACWRWGDSGQRSPWYPTMRLFRSQERSFAPVLKEVGKALNLWVDTWQAR